VTDDDSLQLDPEDDRMLADALLKARRLVAGIEKQQRELLESPQSALEPEKLEQGKQAMENALASARRMLTALEEAVVIRARSVAGQDETHHDN
jgi:hypothetical protein